MTRCILAMFILVCGACSQQFKDFLADETGPYGEFPSRVQLTFLGTSSFLVNTASSSVLIDGYISRERHNLVQPIEPNISRISDTLHALGVATPNSPDFIAPGGNSTGMNDLNAIIPLHGHYDHAMDVAVIAALTGAELYGDEAIERIVQASQNRFEWFPTAFDERQFKSLAVSQSKAESLAVGDITITLFETPHSTNILSRSVERLGDARGWGFPAYINNMKQGTSMAAHVAVGEQAFMIFPTAGKLSGQVERLGLRAETVFLGFGGLGWQNDDSIRAYLLETIGASGARRVFPIHWDDHQFGLEKQLAVPFFESLDRALERIESSGGVDVLPIKAMQPFDPFYRALD